MRRAASLCKERILSLEADASLALNRLSAFDAVRVPLVMASKLGNGIIWYAFLLALPALYGRSAARIDAGMILSGAIVVALHRYLKRAFSRARPFERYPQIYPGTFALDTYSFPSGHTMHAFCFGSQIIHYLPATAWVLAPFVALVCLSRVVLGLHYISDVLAGAVIGFAIGSIGMAVS